MRPGAGKARTGGCRPSRVRTAPVVRPRHGDVRVRLDHAVRRHGGAVAGASRESSRMGSRTVGTGRERRPMGFGDAHGVRPSVSKLVVQAAAADGGHTRVGLGCRDGRSRVFGRAYRDGCLAGASSMEHPARAYGVLDVPRKRDPRGVRGGWPDGRGTGPLADFVDRSCGLRIHRLPPHSQQESGRLHQGQRVTGRKAVRFRCRALRGVPRDPHGARRLQPVAIDTVSIVLKEVYSVDTVSMPSRNRQSVDIVSIVSSV